MRLFSIQEAAHYCAGFTAELGAAEGKLEDFRRQYLPVGTRIHEGAAIFNQYRSCSLRDVEVSLFLAASHYRRCLDCLIPGASHWAHVTMYYGTWYASRAILGMLGATVFKDCVVDVHTSKPGAQQLTIRAIGNGSKQEPTAYKGNSHRKFWDLFYRSTATLRPYVSPPAAASISPVANDPLWLSDRRNDVNYNTHSALKEAILFQGTFSSSTFPTSLSGHLGTQYQVFEGVLSLAFDLARRLSLVTDALAALSPSGTRSAKISRLVYSARTPALVRKTAKTSLLR